MENELSSKGASIDYLECFGDFRADNPICHKFCVLSIRCAIERDQNTRMELLEDFMTSSGMIVTIQ
jgi:hypothetical protein